MQKIFDIGSADIEFQKKFIFKDSELQNLYSIDTIKEYSNTKRRILMPERQLQIICPTLLRIDVETVT